MFFKDGHKIDGILGKLPPSSKEFLTISAILILILTLFFARPISFNLVPSPADLLSNWPMFHVDGLKIQNLNCADVIDQYEPWYLFNYQSIKGLQIPLWNPYGAGGVPHLANMQSSIFFFLTWPFYILGFTGFTLLLFYFAKFFLTGLFSYYYLRSIKLKFYPSLMGAIGFMFVGYDIVWMQWPGSNIMFILPALLYLAEKIVEKGNKVKYFSGMTILIALGILSGHPETFICVPPLAFLYLLYRLRINGSKLSGLLDAALKFAAFSALGIGVSAIQLLPAVEYLLNSSGWAARSSHAASYIPWQAIILNFMPDYYGTNSLFLRVPYYIDIIPYQSTAGYVGISLLCLAAFAILAKYKDHLVKFYVLLGIWAVGVIYHAPLIFQIMTSIPVFAQSKPAGLLFLLGFDVVILGSIGFNEILDSIGKSSVNSMIKKFSLSCLIVLFAYLFLVFVNGQFFQTHYLFTDWVIYAQAAVTIITFILILATLFLVFILAKRANVIRFKSMAVIGLLLLVFLETGGHAMLYLPYIDEQYFHQGPDPFADIVGKGGLYRATSIDPINHQSVYPANVQMIYGVYDIRDYDAIEIRYSRELLKNCTSGNIGGWTDLYGVNKNYLDFMGVKWIYSGADLSRTIDINVSDSTNTIGELKKGHTVAQEFTANRSNLSGIEVYYSAGGTSGARSNITMKLTDKNANAIVRSMTINPSELKDVRWPGQWFMANFEPLNDSGNKTYLLTVSDDDARDSGVIFWMDHGAYLPNGTLYIDGKPANGSLCMRTYHNDDTGYSLVKSYANYYLFQNDGALPRSFIVHNATFTLNDSKILSDLSSPAEDWLSPIHIYGDDRTVSYPDGNSNVTVSEYQPQYVRILANTSTPGFLVLTDTYYPGWNAYVNGKRVDILRADYAFRSVQLDAGSSVVEFKYEPMSFYAGAAVTILSLLILLAIGISIVRKKR